MSAYLQALRQSACNAGNIICLGLDPQWQKLPAPYRKSVELPAAPPIYDTMALQDFLAISLESLAECNLLPAAFKPNLGYFQAMDRPALTGALQAELRQRAFAGSALLAWLHKYLAQKFPGIPVILDYKKGDIARSSANYAEEGLVHWGADAVTVNPYMGSDSLAPFGAALRQHLGECYGEEVADHSSRSCDLPYGEGGVYSLLRTSNPGGSDLQALEVQGGRKLYQVLAETLLRWRGALGLPGLGAVVGATSLAELQELAECFAAPEFPLLIPGVGRQGGSFAAVCTCLENVGYPLDLARINLSSGLLQSWEGEAPRDWRGHIVQRFSELVR